MSETSVEKQTFQAEVQQLLDIVINSLYTDKEIFVRELVSNASDALEKLRYTMLTEKEVFDGDLDLEINITTDEEANTITIADHGIGMTRDELMENLGTIAHSGSKKFLNALGESDSKQTNLIGQFGVGFYSAFMVSDDVKVYTHSWQNDGEHLSWSSDGKSGYTIEEDDGQRRGTKIVIQLRDDQKEFAGEARIKNILENYSNFVPFPILLNGERVNTVEAIWMKSKSEVTDEQYSEFYKFAAKAFDEPRYRMHFSADAPLQINSLLFVPDDNPEKMGMGQVDPGVALYCNKVMIDGKPKGLLPDWLRCLKGVVDSEDLPLNISRESMQDSALVTKLNRVITKRFIKFLDSEAKSDAEKYAEFHERFRTYLKEGIVTDGELRESIAKLLRFESSMSDGKETVGFEDYIARMKDGQDKIYFQIAPDRGAIEAAPYLEAFKARGLEVLYLYDAVDEYMIGALEKFDDKDMVSIDREDVELDDVDAEGEALEGEKLEAFTVWMKEALGDKVKEISAGKRLVDSPVAALTPGGAMSPQMKHMMRQMNPDFSIAKEVKLEINPRHSLIHRLEAAREERPDFAKTVAEQMLDNALVAAGLLEEGKDMVARIYSIMEEAL